MRPWLILVFVAALAAPPARAAACVSHWRVDHYVYDAALHRDWEVLVSCDHPAVPARMELLPAGVVVNSSLATGAREAKSKPSRGATKHFPPPVCVKAGTAVEVSNAASSVVSMRLTGTAMQTAFPGQPVRVRLSAGGHFVNAIVRGPHEVELASTAKSVWGRP